MSSTFAVAVATAAAIVAQLLWRVRANPTVLVGDENEYLTRATSPDPFGPEPFLRLPGFIAIVRGSRTVGMARAVNTALSVATVTITTAATATTVSPTSAMIAGVVLALIPDRVVISQHVWPDVPMATMIAAGLLAITHADASWALWLGAGCAAALASLRVDGCVAAVLIGAAAPTNALRATIVIAVVVAVGAAAIRTRIRYRTWMPDTTVLFNIRVANTTTAGGERQALELAVASVNAHWLSESAAQRTQSTVDAIRALARHPVTAAAAFVRRFLAMCGPDTFVIQRLLMPNDGPYAHVSIGLRRGLAGMARWSFPAILAAATVSVQHVGRVHAIVGTMLVMISAVHARTRFRHAMLPGLSVLVGASAEIVLRGDLTLWWAVAAAAVLLSARYGPTRTETGTSILFPKFG